MKKQTLLDLWCARLPSGAEREVRFLPSRRWRMDVAYRAEKVAVEVHGGVWSQGRHTRGAGFLADREKMNEAQLHGWLVLEVGYEQITNGQADAWLLRALSLRKQERECRCHAPSESGPSVALASTELLATTPHDEENNAP